MPEQLRDVSRHGTGARALRAPDRATGRMGPRSAVRLRPWPLAQIMVLPTAHGRLIARSRAWPQGDGGPAFVLCASIGESSAKLRTTPLTASDASTRGRDMTTES